ncbi:hypothetical protein KIH74_06105 [Kineosporia sp. J2-2]|uniref:Transcriptional regulator n=1 Tax=Kineosporia corallincola TaxID=2835133 RepID=A0ABS5TFV9_9ACTN|nr:hypothetical protein [Kineosporia corallincola]MBT0768489.1 hypothetical protein [Kineosporia corallincola]
MEWTDDLRVRVAPGTSLLALVEYLRAAGHDRLPRREVLGVLTERFALSFDDARLAMERVEAGAVRARTTDPANEPDPAADPLARLAYRLERGLPVEDDAVVMPPQVRDSARELLENARNGTATRGTGDVGVALEVARQAVASQEPGPVRFRLLVQAATCLSTAAEACIERLGDRPCAPEGSREWVEGVALAAAAREVTARFAARPDPGLEERGLGLAGRIVTGLLGQCHAFVGRAMTDSAACALRNGDPDGAAGYAQAVVADFAVLLDAFDDDIAQDEDVVAVEHLLSAVDLLIEVRGVSPGLGTLRDRTARVLNRATTDRPGAG